MRYCTLLFLFLVSSIFCYDTVYAANISDVDIENYARVFTSTSLIGVANYNPLNDTKQHLNSLSDFGSFTDDDVFIFDSSVLQDMLDFVTDLNFSSNSYFTVVGGNDSIGLVPTIFDAGFTVSSELSDVVASNSGYCMYSNQANKSTLSFAPFTSTFMIDDLSNIATVYYDFSYRDWETVKDWTRYVFTPSFTDNGYSLSTVNALKDSSFLIPSSGFSSVVGQRIVCFKDENAFNQFYSSLLAGMNYTYLVYPALVSFPKYVSYETLTQTNFAAFAVQTANRFNAQLQELSHDDGFSSGYNRLLQEFSNDICAAFECLREPLTVSNVFEQENVDKLIPDSGSEPEQPPSGGNVSFSDIYALAQLISYGVAWLICLGSVGILTIVALIIYNALYKHIF